MALRCIALQCVAFFALLTFPCSAERFRACSVCSMCNRSCLAGIAGFLSCDAPPQAARCPCVLSCAMEAMEAFLLKHVQVQQHANTQRVQMALSGSGRQEEVGSSVSQGLTPKAKSSAGVSPGAPSEATLSPPKGHKVTLRRAQSTPDQPKKEAKEQPKAEEQKTEEPEVEEPKKVSNAEEQKEPKKGRKQRQKCQQQKTKESPTKQAKQASDERDRPSDLDFHGEDGAFDTSYSKQPSEERDMPSNLDWHGEDEASGVGYGKQEAKSAAEAKGKAKGKSRGKGPKVKPLKRKPDTAKEEPIKRRIPSKRPAAAKEDPLKEEPQKSPDFQGGKEDVTAEEEPLKKRPAAAEEDPPKEEPEITTVKDSESGGDSSTAKESHNKSGGEAKRPTFAERCLADGWYSEHADLLAEMPDELLPWPVEQHGSKSYTVTGACTVTLRLDTKAFYAKPVDSNIWPDEMLNAMDLRRDGAKGVSVAVRKFGLAHACELASNFLCCGESKPPTIWLAEASTTFAKQAVSR